jgi:hypothetical protein
VASLGDKLGQFVGIYYKINVALRDYRVSRVSWASNAVVFQFFERYGVTGWSFGAHA